LGYWEKVTRAIAGTISTNVATRVKIADTENYDVYGTSTAREHKANPKKIVEVGEVGHDDSFTVMLGLIYINPLSIIPK
jgi:hypothetical protein